MSVGARCLAALLISMLASACSISQSAGRDGEPTLTEAHGFLRQMVALAQRGDFASLCAFGDGNCVRSLDAAGRDGVPSEPPTLIGTRFIPTQATGDQVSIGGLVLELSGRDAKGRAYSSEMLVFRDRSALKAINPVYWDNTKISGGIATPASPGPSASCPGGLGLHPPDIGATWGHAKRVTLPHALRDERLNRQPMDHSAAARVTTGG